MLRDTSADRDCLPTSQAAERAGLSVVHIRRLLTSGQLEGLKMGRDWWVYADSLEKYMATPHKPGPKGPIKKKDREEGSDIAL